ncbi:MAG: AMP-binding protein, partial [Candidatus Aminicenantes bacterium]
MVNPGRKITIDKKNIEDVYALTPLQEGLLFHYLEDPAHQRNQPYLVQLCLDISGHIKWTLFKKAWQVVVETNEMMRTVFRWEQLEKPVQVVLKKNNLQIHFYDYSHKTHIDQKKLTKKLINEDKNKKFNLHQVPLRITLCKTRENHYKIIFTYHHILLDGWSTGIILNEFFKNYYDLVQHRELAKPVKNRFKDYVKWIKSQEQHNQHQKKYWKDYLKGFDTPVALPIKQRTDKGENKENRDRVPVGRYQIILANEIKDNLDRHLKSGKITLAALLYSAWGILLHRYTNTRDIILGTTVSGRSAPIEGIENMVGLFINTIPLRLKTYPGEKIKDLLNRTNKDLQTRETRESTSLMEIKKYSELRHQEELFDSIVVIENYPLPKDLIPGNKGLAIQSYSMKETSNYDLTVIISVFSGIEISLVYDNHSFAQETMVRLSGHFTRIIREIATYPEKEIAGVDILSNEEKELLLETFNNTEAVYPGGKTIHQLFAGQVERIPDHIAVKGAHELHELHEKGTRGLAPLYISYKELNQQASQLAYLLIEKGVHPDTIVGIMMERSIEMIMGILGILKAGGAYLPIDPQYPAERITYMLKDSRAEILLSKVSEVSEVKGHIETMDLTTIKADKNENLPSRHISLAPQPLHPSPTHLTPLNLAYIIYTSGSTGNPKGVLVDQQSVINILFALHKEYPLREPDTFLLKTAVVFDVSVIELFGWYIEGGRLAILAKGAEKDPAKIINAVENFTVTHINFVPSMFAAFVEALNRRNINKLSSLKYIFLAGEALSPGLVEKFKCLGTGIVLENLYGPTEAAVYSSKYSLSEWNPGESIPIGKPLSNIQLYILNKDNLLQPIGIPGELGIGGVGVSRGYLNQPGLTAEKFDHDLWDYQDYHDKKLLQGGEKREAEKLGRWEDGKLRSELRSISRQQPETNENQHKR